MDDLISRRQAVDALGEEPLAWEDGDYELGCVNQWKSDVEAIKALPSAEPQERKGKWIEDKGQQTLMQNCIERGEVWRVCSVCGAGHMIGHKYANDKAYHDRHHNYCPNCGADMRGEQNG